jgi:hypothetical protein
MAQHARKKYSAGHGPLYSLYVDALEALNVVLNPPQAVKADLVSARAESLGCHDVSTPSGNCDAMMATPIPEATILHQHDARKPSHDREDEIEGSRPPRTSVRRLNMLSMPSTPPIRTPMNEGALLGRTEREAEPVPLRDCIMALQDVHKSATRLDQPTDRSTTVQLSTLTPKPFRKTTTSLCLETTVPVACQSMQQLLMILASARQAFSLVFPDAQDTPPASADRDAQSARAERDITSAPTDADTSLQSCIYKSSTLPSISDINAAKARCLAPTTSEQISSYRVLSEAWDTSVLASPTRSSNRATVSLSIHNVSTSSSYCDASTAAIAYNAGVLPLHSTTRKPPGIREDYLEDPRPQTGNRSVFSLATSQSSLPTALAKLEVSQNQEWILVKPLVEKQMFDSQTKEQLAQTSRTSGSKPDLTESSCKSIVKSGMGERVLNWPKFKSNQLLAKSYASDTVMDLSWQHGPMISTCHSAFSNSDPCLTRLPRLRKRPKSERKRIQQRNMPRLTNLPPIPVVLTPCS